MSVLKLTSFTNKTSKDRYKPYELSQMPEQGEDVFIYHKEGDNIVNDPTDKANFSIVRKAFGYAAKDKFDKMAVVQVKNNSGKNKGNEFINSIE